jgi:hypothetical protein
MTTKSKNMGILSDHKRSRKRLIPPFVHMFGEIEEVSWVRTGIPEYLWLALAHQQLGDRPAVEAVSALARVCRRSHQDHTNQPFSATSSYISLSEDVNSDVRAALASGGHLFELQKCLRILASLYPSCPLKLLYTDLPDTDVNASLKYLRDIVEALYDRSSLLCVKVQATVVYLAFDAGLLRVKEGLALAQFPEIEDYPLTEISKRVAGSIRATINMFMGQDIFVPKAGWPKEFWNRSYALSPCEVWQDE